MSEETLTQTEAVAENNQLYQSDKEFNRNKWFFCLGGIGRDALYTLVSTYFLTYVQFGLTLTAAQFTTLSLLIGILGRIWDGINDPMMGAIIDGSHLKWGKFKPWIFYGALADSILTVVLFNFRLNLSSSAQGWIYVAAICGIYLLWEASFTMNDIGYWSMIPSLARTKERRDKMTTLTIFCAGLGTILMTAMVTYLAPGNLLNAYTMFSIIACVMVIACQTMTTFGVKEAPREESEEKPENKISLKKMVKTIFNNKQLLWMGLALLCESSAFGILMGLIYNFYYMEIGYDGNVIIFVVIYAVANTVFQLVYPPMAKRMGRRKIQLMGISILSVGFIGLMLAGWFKFFPINLLTLCLFGVPIFVGYTWFYTATLVNVSNCVEYNEWKTGERNEAVVSTVRPLIVKFGDAIKYLTVTLTLVLSGIYAITQHVSAIENQVSQFERKIAVSETAETSIEDYIIKIANYSVKVQKLEKELGTGTDEFKAEIKKLDEEISADEVLRKCQIQAEYTPALAKLWLVQYDKDGKTYQNAKQVESFAGNIELDTEIAVKAFVTSENKYKLVVTPAEYNKANKADENAVNDVFQKKVKEDNGGLKVRLVLRIAFCGLPLLLFVLSYLIQRTKFIIDEKFFDQMVKEIEERKGNLPVEETKQEELPTEEPKE